MTDFGRAELGANIPATKGALVSGAQTATVSVRTPPDPETARLRAALEETEARRDALLRIFRFCPNCGRGKP